MKMAETKYPDCQGKELEEGPFYWHVSRNRIAVMEKREDGFVACYCPGGWFSVTNAETSRDFLRMGEEEARTRIRQLETEIEWIKTRFPIKVPEDFAPL